VRASLNTRVVWLLSAVLTLGGAGLLFASGLTASEETLWERGLHALFQSVTARTAGFNTIDVGALPLASLLLLIPLMFVGGSPASCAGGVKTTSLGIWAARVVTRLRGREDVNILERHIPHEIVRRATLVIAVAVVWITLGVFILVLTESGANPHFALEDLIFEQVSAFATVGLSTGITSELTPLGKIWIILSMFVGRLGPLTVALVVMQPHREQVHYPTERVMVG
jgi:trk system potassium uptake protein TrkH